MGKLFSAALYYLLLIPISLLPFSIIYFISDFVYVLLYRIVGYRKSVVRQNLRNSFPDKSAAELLDIERKFYSQFCDNILEGLKGLTLSKEEVMRRMKCRNPELLNGYFDQGKSVIITTGHYYSWELWFLGIDLPVRHQVVLIYKKLSNTFFEEKLKKIRQSFGVLPLKFEGVKDFFEKEENGKYAYIFGSDQAPHNANRAYWVRFLNQETPVAFGAEKFAGDKDIPVVFCRIIRIKRGYYEFEYVNIEAKPTKCQYGDITRAFTLELENTIKRDPVGWLWTHKRWKRKKPEGMEVFELE
jgi:KDO2-lipid IV(A) lauroyltransferase